MRKTDHLADLATLRRRISAIDGPRHKARRELQELTRSNSELLSWAGHSYFSSHYFDKSAVHRLNEKQKLWLVIIAVLIAVMSFYYAIYVLITLISIFTLYCFALLVMRLLLFSISLGSPGNQHSQTVNSADMEFPIITILVPLYQEAESLPYLHEALSQLEYPRDKLDIKILLEQDDIETQTIAHRICIEPEYHLVIVPTSLPRTKPKACNFGLWLARGALIVIYDAEDRPEADQLRKAVQAYAQSPTNAACLQARLNYYNRDQNILTRLFTLEYTLLFDVFLPGLNRLKIPVPLGGTSNIFRTEVLFEIGGWDPFNVTEDADIGLRLARAGYFCEMLSSTTWEEATPEIRGWLRQRSRWIKGYLQTWLVHSRAGPSDILQPEYWRWAISLHLFVGSVLVSSFINPLFWIAYILWASNLPIAFELIFPSPLDALATISFLGGNLFLLYLHMAAPLKRRWYAYCTYALLFPIYWLLQSVAGVMALFQFIRRPFYWEKTDHHPNWMLSNEAERPKPTRNKA